MPGRSEEEWRRHICTRALPIQHEGSIIPVPFNPPHEHFALTGLQLNSLDNMRVDGKFIVNGDIPEGQGSVSGLLAECFDLNYELRVAAEEGTNSDD